MKKLLSIIIRTYNRLEYTVRTINSIDEKSGLDKDQYEIILVDQLSTDGTREWISSIIQDDYYPVRAVFLPKNIGDGRGMQEGIKIAKGDFIAQHDNDIALVSEKYYARMIRLYQFLEKRDLCKVCSLGGIHIQGVNFASAPFRFANAKWKTEGPSSLVDSFCGERVLFYFSAWVTASFIFRKKFSKELEFGKGTCNSWCGEWFDRGYDNVVCPELKFWHIDSLETGAHVQKQFDKFPNYKYIFRHYKGFVNKDENE